MLRVGPVITKPCDAVETSCSRINNYRIIGFGLSFFFLCLPKVCRKRLNMDLMIVWNLIEPCRWRITTLWQGY